ncbi:MAG: hypothetical protein H3C31_07645 [Brumimicrobium sp.]|nr:hypothetical protein [Brumimicrobium sp.]MCO5267952.1 hypothetical protein [Brumimicrobium sp.]
MKRKPFLLTAFFAVLTLLFTACPYSSSISLGEAKEAVDASLFGNWYSVSDDSEHPYYYQLADIDGKTFSVKKFEYNESDAEYDKTDSYKAHFTTIDGTKFLNLFQNDTYYFYKLEFTSTDTFKLQEVTDNIEETFDTSDAMYKFFKTYKNLSFFYTKGPESYQKR